MKTNLIAVLTLAGASVMFGAQTPAKPAAVTGSATPAASTATVQPAKKHVGIFHKKHAKKAVKATTAAKATAPASVSATAAKPVTK